MNGHKSRLTVTDATTMRPVMKWLIEERKVKTKGERREMTYLTAGREQG